MLHGSVLVVGDDPALRTAIRLNLEGEGVRVFETDSRDDGGALPAGARPDICILDLHAPTEREWTKLPALRGWPALQNVPVLVVADEPPDALTMDAFRPDAHMIKPFHAADLVRNVQRMLKRVQRSTFHVPRSHPRPAGEREVGSPVAESG